MSTPRRKTEIQKLFEQGQQAKREGKSSGHANQLGLHDRIHWLNGYESVSDLHKVPTEGQLALLNLRHQLYQLQTDCRCGNVDLDRVIELVTAMIEHLACQ